MSYDIGNLEIQIISDATKATTGLDRFTQSLSTLSATVAGITNTTALTSLATGIREIGLAVNSAKLDGRTVNTLVNSLNKLNAVKSANYATSATGLNQMVGAIQSISTVAPQSAQAIRDLGNAINVMGSQRAQTAVANIPLLGNALRNLMATLSTAPVVSRNLIDMTNALARFSASGARVPAVTRQVSAGLQRTAETAKVTSHQFRSMVSSIGLFYARFFLIIRGIKKLWQATESAMNFVETFNYWSVALDKISKEYENKFSDAGEKSADAFAESYSDKLKTLTKKMTGYTLGDKGELIIGDSIGLGLDPNQLLEYQARIMGITNSVGLMGDASINTAKALSMLSADISSLTNTDLSTVMTNLQSGLVGQSRALYKYGIDITSATLKEIAMAHGITESVTAMSQSEKMQLRILAILQDSRIAWGDQARTINTVANQYRILKQQVSNLGRILGNLLLPIVKTVLPYLNAIIIVLQRLFTALGYKLWGDSWLSDLNEDVTSIATDDMEDYSDAVDDATDSVKKLKSQLLGIDELNNLTSSDGNNGAVASIGDWDLSGAIEDALAEYERVWEDALKKAQNRAEELANKMFDFLGKIANSKFGVALKDLWETLKKIAGVTFDTALDFWNKFLKPVASWLGNDVFATLVSLFKQFVDDIDWDTIKSALANLYEIVAKFVVGVGKGLLAFFEPIAKLGLKLIANAINIIAKALDFLFKIINKIPEKVWTAIGGAIGAFLTVFVAKKYVIPLITKFGYAILNLAGNLVFFVAQGGVTSFITGIITTIKGLVTPTNIIIALTGAIVALYTTVRKETREKAIQSLFDGLSTEKLEEFSRNGVVTLEELSGQFSTKVSEIGGQFDKLGEKLNDLSESHVSLGSVTEEIDGIFKALDMGAYTAGEKIDDIISAFNSLKIQTQSIFQEEYDAIMLGLAGAVGDAYSAMGGDLDAIVQAMALAKADGDVALADLYASISALETQYKTGEITADDYVKQVQVLYQQLSAFTGSGVADQTAKDVESINQALDISSFIKNGTFDQTGFANYFQEMANQVVNGTAELKQVGEDYKNELNGFISQLESLGIDTSQIDVDGMLQANTNVIAENTDAYIKAWEEYTNQLQIGLAEQLPSIIETATSDWNNLSWLEKQMTPKEEYVSNAVNKWQTDVVDPLAEQIQGSFDTLGVEGAPWVSDAITEMMTNAFRGGDYIDETGATVFQSKMTDDVIGLVNASLEDIEGMLDMETFGEGVLNGFANSVSDSKNQAESQKAMEEWGENLYKWFHDSKLKFGSPSQAMYDFGTDTLTGYANGLNDSTALAKVKASITTFSSNIISTFKSTQGNYQELGRNIVQGIIDGISNKLPDLKEKVKELAKTIVDTTEEELDINSPSKVMFGLGEWTTEGFKNGMESLFGDTRKSLKNFTGEIASAPNQQMSVGSMGMSINGVNGSNIYPAIYDAMVSALSTVGGNNTNVNVTLQGDAQGLFKVVQQESNKFTRRTGQSAFA